MLLKIWPELISTVLVCNGLQCVLLSKTSQILDQTLQRPIPHRLLDCSYCMEQKWLSDVDNQEQALLPSPSWSF